VGTNLIRVAIVEDHPVFRQGLIQVIDAAEDLLLLFAVRSVEEFAGDAERPDVVILDLGLPGVSGSEAVRHVTSTGAATLVVSAQGRQHDVLDAISAGASGYVTKNAEPREIVEAIRTIAEGGTYVSATLASYLLMAARSPESGRGFTLTGREREILSLVAAGETDQDIADHLFISVRTVRSHLDRIREKTGRRRRPDLTRLAIEQGIPLPPSMSPGRGR